MARLTTRRRSALPASKFAGHDRSYPVDTKGRARDAKARASGAVNAGRMSRSEEAAIDRNANRVLGYNGPGRQVAKDAKGRTGKRRSWQGR